MTIELTPALRQALEYVLLLKRAGYRPTAYDVDQFVTTVQPKPARSMRDDMMTTLGPLSGLASFGSQPLPPEPVTQYMVKVGWLIVGDRGQVWLTDLGTAVLSGTDQDRPGENAVQVTLNPQDQLVYVKLSQVLSDCGDDAMLADAYFGHESLWWLVNHTKIRRVLVKEYASRKRQLNDLRLALGNSLAQVEIRSTTGEMHDRCVIPTSGNVTLLGTSVNSIGTKLTVAVRVQDEPSRAYRDTYRKFWDEGAVMEPVTPTTQPTEATSETPEAENNPGG